MANPPRLIKYDMHPWDLKVHGMTLDDMYTLFKRRMIEELRTESITGLGLRLIDTARQRND